MLSKTKGLVLKQRKLSERDGVCTLLTPGAGLIEVVVRGLRTQKSKLAGACQLLTYGEYCLFKGKSPYPIVDAAETEASFYNLRLDVEKTALASYFCELTIRLSPTAEIAADYLRFLLNTLYLLQEDRLTPAQLKAIFELRSLSLAGFMPDLVACAACAAYEQEEMYFLPGEGLLFCGDCIKTKSPENQPVLPLPPPVLQAMRHIVFSELEKLFRFRVTGETLHYLGKITEEYVHLHTETVFSSLKVYHDLCTAD